MPTTQNVIPSGVTEGNVVKRIPPPRNSSDPECHSEERSSVESLKAKHYGLRYWKNILVFFIFYLQKENFYGILILPHEIEDSRRE